ncbi:MAG: glutathione S-transferase family protein [Cypionkella sp.]
MKLYGFGESGNAYKVALMMALTKTPCELELVPFFTGGTRTPEFRAINPMGEVPVLVDGEVMLTQSGVMLEYLAELTGQFTGRDAGERREVLRWLFWDNHKFSAQIGTTRFLMNFLPPDKRPEAVIGFMQARLKAAYHVLENHLASRDWIVGAAATVADLSCCSYLYYPEPFGFDRQDWPNIAGWLDRIAALPGWQHPYDLMPRAFPSS